MTQEDHQMDGERQDPGLPDRLSEQVVEGQIFPRFLRRPGIYADLRSSAPSQVRVRQYRRTDRLPELPPGGVTEHLLREQISVDSSETFTSKTVRQNRSAKLPYAEVSQQVAVWRYATPTESPKSPLPEGSAREVFVELEALDELAGTLNTAHTLVMSDGIAVLRSRLDLHDDEVAGVVAGMRQAGFRQVFWVLRSPVTVRPPGEPVSFTGASDTDLKHVLRVRYEGRPTQQPDSTHYRGCYFVGLPDPEKSDNPPAEPRSRFGRLGSMARQAWDALGQ